LSGKQKRLPIIAVTLNQYSGCCRDKIYESEILDAVTEAIRMQARCVVEAAVVVLPTPPFWFEIAIVLGTMLLLL